SSPPRMSTRQMDSVNGRMSAAKTVKANLRLAKGPSRARPEPSLLGVARLSVKRRSGVGHAAGGTFVRAKNMLKLSLKINSLAKRAESIVHIVESVVQPVESFFQQVESIRQRK